MSEFADVVVVAAAESFRGDGEIFGSGMGTIPMLGARMARSTFEPDLLVSDGEAFFLANEVPIGGTEKVIEGWTPFRSVFETLWSGRRHVMMGASQMDRFGNSNIANIGPWKQPKSQLLGVRGGPGNTINHTTSFFIPKHTSRVFTPNVDMVSGLGYDRVAKLSAAVQSWFELRRVITNLAVLDFNGPEHTMHLVSLHPGASVDDVVANTGFELHIDGDVPTTREPTAEELEVINRLDPKGFRHREVAL
jgi:acyl CoA:acetate/3-ketoacid CoA transferase beta subunit